MAKTGFWLRGTRGKFAGASFGRGVNGGTVMREIVTPRNPRTNKQLYQRAIMATVMRAYGAGKAIFDHSFQFKSFGAQNQQEFMKLNARLLRSLVASEWDQTPDLYHPQLQVRARLVAPGVNSPVGFDGMIISQGSYDQRFFTVNAATDDGSTETNLSFATPAPLDGETFAAYAQRNGLVANDYYTFVGFFHSNQSVFDLDTRDYLGASQVAEQFFFIRLRVKPEFVGAEVVITADTAISEIFEITATSVVGVTPAALLAVKIGAEFATEVLGGYPGAVVGSGQIHVGLIRSRLDQDLRSNTTLMRGAVHIESGITPYYILDAWKRGTQQVGTSEYILEGGGDFPEGEA